MTDLSITLMNCDEVSDNHLNANPPTFALTMAPNSNSSQTLPLTEKSRFTPQDAIKKVGKGKTLSQDLTQSEAQAAFEALCHQEFTPVQFGAFLQALRIKELSQDELNALYFVVRNHLVTTASEAKADLTVNLSSDTARKGGLLTLLACQVLGHAGISCQVLRSEPVLSQNRDSYALTRSLKLQAPGLKEFHLGEILPQWSKMDSLRSEIGFRSCLHTVEKMLNPCPEAPLVLGISHRQYADRMAHTLQLHGQSGCILLGNHGTPDVVLHKPTEAVLITPEAITTAWIDPKWGGLEPDPGIYSLAQFKLWPDWFTPEMPGNQCSWPPGFQDALILQTATLFWVTQPQTEVIEILPQAAQWVHAWKEQL